MKNNYINNRLTYINLALTVFFTSLMFLTFDRLVVDTVTDESPLLKIGELYMGRMDFVTLLFTLTVPVGVVAGILLHKRVKIMPISNAVLGALLIFFALFNVDVLQMLDPTMRISHVVMSLSRIMAIVLGVSGIPVGLSVSAAVCGGVNKLPRDKAAVAGGLLFALLAAVFVVAEKAYRDVYLLSGIAVLVIAIASDIFMPKSESAASVAEASASSAIKGAINVISALGAVFLAVVTPNYLGVALGMSALKTIVVISVAAAAYVFAASVKNIGYTGKYIALICAAAFAVALIYVQNYYFITVSVIIIAFALGISAVNKQPCPVTMTATALGTFAAAVLAYTAIHAMGAEQVFSVNRIVYTAQPSLFILVIVMLVILAGLTVCLQLSDKRAADKRVNQKTEINSIIK